MRHSTLFLACVCLNATVVGFRTAHAGSESLGQGGPCRGALNGTVFPHLIPEYAAWHALFRHVDSLDAPTVSAFVGGNAKAARSIVDVSRALVTLTSLGSSVEADNAYPPSVSHAATTLAARDELIRALDPGAFERVRARYLQIRGKARYTFAKLGIRVAKPAAAHFSCLVSINGKDDPYLVPEGYVWEFYFHARADTTSKALTPSGSMKPEYLSAVRAAELRIPLPEVYLVLQTASDVDGRIKALRQTSTDSTHQQLDRRAEEIVLAARDRLARLLPPASWTALLTDVEKVRRSTIFDFPCEN